MAHATRLDDTGKGRMPCSAPLLLDHRTDSIATPPLLQPIRESCGRVTPESVRATGSDKGACGRQHRQAGKGQQQCLPFLLDGFQALLVQICFRKVECAHAKGNDADPVNGTQSAHSQHGQQGQNVPTPRAMAPTMLTA